MISTSIQTPVVIFCYNRPYLLKLLLKGLKKYKFKNLYFCVDGPKNNLDDKNKVNLVLKELVKFKKTNRCKILSSNINLGLRIHISRNLRNLLEAHNRLIILEDDIEISDSFFNFMEDALNEYEKNSKIMHITGYNMVPRHKLKSLTNSHRLSLFGGSYAWATWADRWKKYEDKIKILDAFLVSIKIALDIKNFWAAPKWVLNFLAAKFNLIDSWAYRWFLVVRKNNAYCIIPNKNLVKYNGRSSGTHNRFNIKYAELPRQQIKFKKNNLIDWDKQADIWRAKYGQNSSLNGVIIGFLFILYKVFIKFLKSLFQFSF